MKAVKFLFGSAEGEPTDVVEAEFTDDEWRVLELFCRFADELFSDSSLASRGIATTLNVSWKQEAGLTTTTELPDWNDVIVLLHRLRPLILKSEATFFSSVRKVLSRRVKHPAIRSHLKYLSHVFYAGDLQAIAVAYASRPADDDFHVINSEQTLQKWLNGFEYHRDQDKRQFIESLHGLLPLDASKVFFLQMLAEKVRAISVLRSCIDVLRGETERAVYRVPPEEPLRHRVLLLPVIDSISFFDDVMKEGATTTPRGLVSFSLPVAGQPPNLLGAIEFLWNRWLEGALPIRLGTTHILLQIPDGFRFLPGDAPAKNAALIFTVSVRAVVVTYQGEIRSRPAKDSAGHVYLRLDSSSVRRKGAVVIPDRETLQRFLAEAKETGARIEVMVKVPRFVFQSSYWPPTSRAAERIVTLRRAGKQPTFEDVEGPDLAAAWEIFGEIGLDLQEHGIKLDVEVDDIE